MILRFLALAAIIAAFVGFSPSATRASSSNGYAPVTVAADNKEAIAAGERATEKGQ